MPHPYTQNTVPIPTPTSESYTTTQEENDHKRKVLVAVIGPFFGICVLIVAISLAIRYWKEKRKQKTVKSAAEMNQCPDDVGSVPYSPTFGKYPRDLEAATWKPKPARQELPGLHG
ncbi:uncharacterized protein GIQ15_05038 [Arthroderma uncinatum]|uniref:uncharacterized protein n=1 Tax=Arthroderma uncinatum TaxID=74035 RepID=UPI00144AA08D|nr:uncharacterized protein GIQ15_05038 [Arthroderma uncinatum]KAF3482279.1 hypothetical protein GIQ15_05038 [Arthroderma uncinatum]